MVACPFTASSGNPMSNWPASHRITSVTDYDTTSSPLPIGLYDAAGRKIKKKQNYGRGVCPIRRPRLGRLDAAGTLAMAMPRCLRLTPIQLDSCERTGGHEVHTPHRPLGNSNSLTTRYSRRHWQNVIPLKGLIRDTNTCAERRPQNFMAS